MVFAGIFTTLFGIITRFVDKCQLVIRADLEQRVAVIVSDEVDAFLGHGNGFAVRALKVEGLAIRRADRSVRDLAGFDRYRVVGSESRAVFEVRHSRAVDDKLEGVYARVRQLRPLLIRHVHDTVFDRVCEEFLAVLAHSDAVRAHLLRMRDVRKRFLDRDLEIEGRNDGRAVVGHAALGPVGYFSPDTPLLSGSDFQLRHFGPLRHVIHVYIDDQVVIAGIYDRAADRVVARERHVDALREHAVRHVAERGPLKLYFIRALRYLIAIDFEILAHDRPCIDGHAVEFSLPDLAVFSEQGGEIEIHLERLGRRNGDIDVDGGRARLVCPLELIVSARNGEMEAVFARRGKHAALAVRNDDTQLGSIDDVAELYLLLIKAVRHPFAAVIITALNEQALVPSEVTARIHRGIFPPALVLAAARAHALFVGLGVGLVEPLVGKHVEVHFEHGFRHIERHGDGIRRTVDRAERRQLAFAVIEVDGIVGVVEREVDAARIAARDHRAALGERARHRDGQNAVFAAFRIDHGLFIALDAEDKAVADNERERTEGRTVVNAVKLHSALNKRLLTNLAELHGNFPDVDIDGLGLDLYIGNARRIFKIVVLALERYLKLDRRCICADFVFLIVNAVALHLVPRRRADLRKEGCGIIHLAIIRGSAFTRKPFDTLENIFIINVFDVQRFAVFKLVSSDPCRTHGSFDDRLADGDLGISAVFDQVRGLVEVRVAAVNNDRIISSDVGRGVRSVHRGELISRVFFILFEPFVYGQFFAARSFDSFEVSLDKLDQNAVFDGLSVFGEIVDNGIAVISKIHSRVVQLERICVTIYLAAVAAIDELEVIIAAAEPDPQIRLCDRKLDGVRLIYIIVRAVFNRNISLIISGIYYAILRIQVLVDIYLHIYIAERCRRYKCSGSISDLVTYREWTPAISGTVNFIITRNISFCIYFGYNDRDKVIIFSTRTV